MSAPATPCDVCGNDCNGEKHDVRLQVMGGRIWATACKDCAARYGAEYGTGKGQQFWWAEPIGWYKVKG